MQELIKSIISFSWGMSLFGLKESSKLLSPAGPGEVVRESETILSTASQAASQSLGPGLQKTYEYGDRIQRKLVDAGFGLVENNDAVNTSLVDPTQWLNPVQYLKVAFDFFQTAFEMPLRQAGEGDNQKPTGWGPIPPPPGEP